MTHEEVCLKDRSRARHMGGTITQQAATELKKQKSKLMKAKIKAGRLEWRCNDKPEGSASFLPSALCIWLKAQSIKASN